jgi:hypothetical protein
MMIEPPDVPPAVEMLAFIPLRSLKVPMRSEESVSCDVNIPPFACRSTLGVNGEDFDIIVRVEENIATIPQGSARVDHSSGDAIACFYPDVPTPCPGTVQIATVDPSRLAREANSGIRGNLLSRNVIVSCNINRTSTNSRH